MTFLFVSALLKRPTKTYRSASHSRSPFQHCNSLKNRRAKQPLKPQLIIPNPQGFQLEQENAISGIF